MRGYRIIEGEHDELVGNRRRRAAGKRLAQRGANEQNGELNELLTMPVHPGPERRTINRQSSLELEFARYERYEGNRRMD